MSWTDERIEKLTKMWEGGATASQIAEELGGVSRNAVIGKAHRLGLKARPSSVQLMVLLLFVHCRGAFGPTLLPLARRGDSRHAMADQPIPAAASPNSAARP